MRIYIMTDLEGPAGVNRFTQTRDFHDDPSQKDLAIALLTGEVNACVDGILDTDPQADIVIVDGHGNGGLDYYSIHPKAKVIMRGPMKSPTMLDQGFDAHFFVGQHAMAGTPNAPLCHTYSSKTVEYYKLNGMFVGEFGARTILGGTYGVPTVFISGDDKAVAEAKAMVPGIHGAIVKWGLGWEVALHLSHDAACALTRKTAAAATRDIPNIPPYIMEPPYTFEARVKVGVDLSHYLALPGVRQIDEQTVTVTVDDLTRLPI